MNLPASIQGPVNVMLDQRNKGERKYGQPVEQADLSMDEWIRHAQEEVADASVYLHVVGEKFRAIEEIARQIEALADGAEVIGLVRKLHEQLGGPTLPMGYRVVSFIRPERKVAWAWKHPETSRSSIPYVSQDAAIDAAWKDLATERSK